MIHDPLSASASRRYDLERPPSAVWRRLAQAGQTTGKSG